MVLACGFLSGSAAPQRLSRGAPEPRLMSGVDVRLAYKLIDSMNPFPSEASEVNMPLAWRLGLPHGPQLSLTAGAKLGPAPSSLGGASTLPLSLYIYI